MLNNTVRVSLDPPQHQVAVSSKDLPMGAGNNWSDTAFKGNHQRRQVLANEAFSLSYQPSYKKTHNPKPEVDSHHARVFADCLDKAIDKTDFQPTEQWVSLDDKVLKFFAFFLEKQKESPAENVRVRKVHITFYPSDDTILIQEARVQNSGLQGGPVLKRQKCPASAAELRRREENGILEGCITLNDLNVGVVVTIFGHEYHIYDCDAYTREFLTCLGVAVPDALRLPPDEYSKYRSTIIDPSKQPKTFESKDLAIAMESMRNKGMSVGHYADDVARVQRFLNDSGKVLRFFAMWDDRAAPAGTVHKMEIRYYVEDDCISIVDRSAESPGFLSKRRLPKTNTFAKSVELSFQGRVNGQREPYLGSGENFYNATDFSIGGEISVFGRILHIFDCDAFTRTYFEQMYGVTLGDPIDISHLEPRKTRPKLPVPPPNGFGTPEDSKASCGSLVLKPPKRNLARWEELDGEMLRYKLRLHKPQRAEDNMRRFVLSFFPVDGTIAVNELPLRNTGFTGGKFMRRQKINKCEGEDASCYYNSDDLRVGAVINLCGFMMEVIESEGHTDEFLKREANGGKRDDASQISGERLASLMTAFHRVIDTKFVNLTEAFRALDRNRDGYVTLDELLTALKHNQVTSSEEDAVAVLQELDHDGSGKISYSDFIQHAAQRSAAGGNSAAAPVKAHTTDVAQRQGSCRGVADVHKDDILRNQILKQLKEKFEARCLNAFEMFRMLSTMPRAMPGPHADMASLTNGAKDVVITPIQLRRGVTESLGMQPSPKEMATLLKFFFPDLPASEYTAERESVPLHAVTMRDFTAKLVEMGGIDQLKKK